MVREAQGWLKKNVAAVVTWALVLLAAAMAWGKLGGDMAAHAERVTELRKEYRDAQTERAALKTDVRVLDTRLSEIVSRLERVASKLERVKP